MDVLSDTLSVVRLAGAVFFTTRLSSPWALASPPAVELARFLHLDSDCVTLFHILVEGDCWVSLEDGKTMQLAAGDVAIFPRGDCHVMASGHGIAPKSIAAVLPPLPFDGIPLVEDGGTGRLTRFICGYLHCDQRFNPLMGALPELLVLRAATADEPGAKRAGTPALPPAFTGPSSAVVPIRAGDWLAATLHHTVEEAESQSPGGEAMLARLSEILFVEALRRYMGELPSTQHGWLAGVRDPVVGHALRLLHAEPERAWTVEDLSAMVSVARSTLAQRFVELIGEPPMRYLTRWRMHLAEGYLRQTSASVGVVARRTGYASEAAFNRAFKHHTGQPPASWRAGSTRAT